MKKSVISLALAAVTLTACGSINEVQTESEPVFYGLGIRNCESGAVYTVQSGSIGKTTMFFDYATMQTAPLCAVPNCTHMTSDCLAKAAEYPVIYDGNAYFFTHSEGFEEQKNAKPEFRMHSALKIASLDNSEVKMMCEFTDAIPKNEETMVICNDTLYFTAFDPEVETDEYGGTSWSSGSGVKYLCSVDLDTGKYTNYGVFYDARKEFPDTEITSSSYISGADNGKIYITYEYSDKALKEEHKFTYKNYEFDIQTEKYSESKLPVALCAADGVYAWLDDDGDKLHVIKDGKDNVIGYDKYTNAACLLNNKLFVNGGWVDTADMSLHLYKGEESQGLTGVAYFDGCYIMRSGSNTFSKLTEEELRAL